MNEEERLEAIVQLAEEFGESVEKVTEDIARLTASIEALTEALKDEAD